MSADPHAEVVAERERRRAARRLARSRRKRSPGPPDASPAAEPAPVRPQVTLADLERLRARWEGRRS